jgi:hypothetical protein
MSEMTPEIAGVSVVLLGSFNPPIFHPSWFARQGLVRSEEAENAEIHLVHPDLVSFTAGWLELQVTQSQFTAATVQDPHESVRDLVVGTFSLLRFTPIDKMGINRDGHFRMASESEWHSVGHRLVPPNNWPFLAEPGMASVTEQGVRSDGREGYIRVKVEPSIPVSPGVYIQVNDHYQWRTAEGETALDSIIQVLQEDWEKSLTRASEAMQAILEQGDGS